MIDSNILYRPIQTDSSAKKRSIFGKHLKLNTKIVVFHLAIHCQKFSLCFFFSPPVPGLVAKSSCTSQKTWRKGIAIILAFTIELKELNLWYSWLILSLSDLSFLMIRLNTVKLLLSSHLLNDHSILGGTRGVLWISIDGDDQRILGGVKILNSRTFSGGKIWQGFFYVTWIFKTIWRFMVFP